MNLIKNYIIGLILAATSFMVFHLIPMTYHIPITDVNSERYYVWLSWFVDHIADSNDTLNFEIASHGGSVFHGYRLVSSIIETDAHTVAKIKSGALSMGAVITVVCDEIEASKYSTIMFHKAGVMGKKINLPIVDRLIADYAFKYMSPFEQDMYNNKFDVWIDGELFAKRFKQINSGQVSHENN